MREEGASQRIIATQYGVAQSYVSRLLNNLDRPVMKPSANVRTHTGVMWTPAAVEEIRLAKRGDPRRLAERHGVSLRYIYDIKYGRKLKSFLPQR
jgi:hypothetical protein